MVLTAALIGAIVGAGVASGVYVATDDDPSATPSSAAIARVSTKIDQVGDIASILKKVEPATVAVTSTGENLGAECGQQAPQGQTAQAAGTGFIISADGYVVTNSHVIAGADAISVATIDGKQLEAELVGRDANADIAVLKVDATNLPAVELGDSSEVQVGDAVVAIGNALALEGTPSVTSGIISALDRSVPTECGNELHNTIQTDAAINRGNSGGPLVNAEGQVIGINTAIADPSQATNVGFAIPISQAQPIIDDLRAGKKPAFLGVATQTLTKELATELDLKSESGAVVLQVTEGSPASQAAILKNDVIVKIGDTDIETSEDVLAAVREHEPGDKVDVVLQRDGHDITVTMELAERPDAS